MISLAELAIWAQVESDLKSELDITLMPVAKRPREACVVYGENPSTETVTISKRANRGGRHYLSWHQFDNGSFPKCPEGARVACRALDKIRQEVPQI